MPATRVYVSMACHCEPPGVAVPAMGVAVAAAMDVVRWLAWATSSPAIKAMRRSEAPALARTGGPRGRAGVCAGGWSRSSTGGRLLYDCSRMVAPSRSVRQLNPGSVNDTRDLVHRVAIMFNARGARWQHDGTS